MEWLADKYTYQARLLPALITTSPVALAIAVWFPSESATWKLIGAVVISSGTVALLPQLARDLGAQKEPWLFQGWGGIPTTRLLSHRMSRLNPVTLARYHAKLRTLLPELTIPTAAEETSSPSHSNDVYNSCTLFLRERTRDRKQFPLVFAENVNYGFRRNLWAAKPVGTASALVGATSCAAFLVFGRHNGQPALLFGIAGALLSSILLGLWSLVFKPNWVRVAAEKYAERLIGSLDSM